MSENMNENENNENKENSENSNSNKEEDKINQEKKEEKEDVNSDNINKDSAQKENNNSIKENTNSTENENSKQENKDSNVDNEINNNSNNKKDNEGNNDINDQKQKPNKDTNNNLDNNKNISKYQKYKFKKEDIKNDNTSIPEKTNNEKEPAKENNNLKENNSKINSSNTKNKNVKNVTDKKKTQTEHRMEKLKKEGKSLLLGGPKKECTICHKFIESHLHQIHYNAHPSQIFKWMYLGTFDTACNISDLRRLGITYVLNLAGECKNTLLPKSITELHLKMKDMADFEVIDYFEQANEFINKVRNSGGTMLIHCKYGVSRSPSFVTAYLVKYFGFNVQSALNFIRKKRPMINPNSGFIEQLEKYEKTFKKKK